MKNVVLCYSIKIKDICIFEGKKNSFFSRKVEICSKCEGDNCI